MPLLSLALRLLFLPLLFIVCVTDTAHGQTVTGRVLDAVDGRPITTGVRLQLLTQRGDSVVSAVSAADGRFTLAARAPGTYQVRATHVGYADAVSEVVLRPREQIVVDLRLSVTAIGMTPLVVTARRRDPRHVASYEGMLARRDMFPLVGSQRVVRFDDAEMQNAGSVADVMLWLSPRPLTPLGQPAVITEGGTGLREPGRTTCTVVFWNGQMVDEIMRAEMFLNDPMAQHLEAVEFYRYWGEAPMDYQQTPGYLMLSNMNDCSVVALWSRRSPLPPVDFANAAMHARLGAGIGWQHHMGSGAPGAAVGARMEALLYVARNVAIGLHARATSAPIGPEVLQQLSGEDPATLGDREFTVTVYGAEVRTDLRAIGRTRPFVAGRVSLARRSFNPHRMDSGDRAESTGNGAGASVGAEYFLRRGVSLHLALDHEMIRFKPFYSLPTYDKGSTWNTTALRAGASFSIQRRYSDDTGRQAPPRR